MRATFQEVQDADRIQQEQSALMEATVAGTDENRIALYRFINATWIKSFGEHQPVATKRLAELGVKYVEE